LECKIVFAIVGAACVDSYIYRIFDSFVKKVRNVDLA